MEIKCLECDKPVPQTPGKRKKEYCGSTCRTKYWKKKKDAGKEKGKPGRPKKAKIVGGLPDKEVKKVANRAASSSKSVSKAWGDAKFKVTVAEERTPEQFMGHKIPKGLKGIELAIWKAEIKEKK